MNDLMKILRLLRGVLQLASLDFKTNFKTVLYKDSVV